MTTARAKKGKATAPQGLDALLDAAALPEKTVEVCLRGDLVAEIEDLERELRDLRTNTETMADRGKARLLAEKIEAARDEMQQYTQVFRLRALNRKAWSALIGLHPPRKDEDGDLALGYNVETFFPALIRGCLVDPQIDDAQWERLDDMLSTRQYDDLAEAAIAVCRRKVDVPFSWAGSAARMRFEGESEQPSV